jgi:serine O-acetyltransferase
MITSLSIEQLENYLSLLIRNHIPDGWTSYSYQSLLSDAMERLEYCFSHIYRKYYRNQGKVVFNHLNTDHMASLLYLLGNTVWQVTGDEELPTRLFYLNKILHGVDLYFSVSMPKIFMLVHPVGTVIGQATYSDYLVIYQNVTIGSNNGVYPTLGKEVILYSKSSLLGNCNVGDNVVFGANSFIINTDIPHDTIVVGQYPSHKFKPNLVSVRERVWS